MQNLCSNVSKVEQQTGAQQSTLYAAIFFPFPLDPNPSRRCNGGIELYKVRQSRVYIMKNTFNFFRSGASPNLCKLDDLDFFGPLGYCASKLCSYNRGEFSFNRPFLKQFVLSIWRPSTPIFFCIEF